MRRREWAELILMGMTLWIEGELIYQALSVSQLFDRILLVDEVWVALTSERRLSVFGVGGVMTTEVL